MFPSKQKTERVYHQFLIALYETLKSIPQAEVKEGHSIIKMNECIELVAKGSRESKLESLLLC